MFEKKSILSVCISCRGNRENKYMIRGGKRFSRMLQKSIRKKNLLLRTVFISSLVFLQFNVFESKK